MISVLNSVTQMLLETGLSTLCPKKEPLDVL